MDALRGLPRPADRRIAVRVTSDALRHLRSGHPWVYDHSITSTSHDGAAGDLAVVFDADRKFVAVGLWDPTSPIRIKVLHHGKPVTVNRAFWSARLRDALARRAPLVEDGRTTGYRCLNGENDGVPGLVLDRYDRTLALKVYSPAWMPHLRDLVAVIDEQLHPDALVLRLARSMPAEALGGLEEGDALIGTAPTEPVLFLEAGLTFEADVVRGQKTGHFLDQRENRRFVGHEAAGASVLDVFAATGGFTVHAAAGGARDVTAIDQSAPTLAALTRNLAHNAHLAEVAACRVTPVVGDAFAEMERLLRDGRRFGVVVVDPPSFAQRQHEVERALTAYGRLTELAVKLTARGGLLVQCSCSSRVSTDEFFAGVTRAAGRIGRELEVVRRTTHAIDHPVTFPEGAYLKAMFARVP